MLFAAQLASAQQPMTLVGNKGEVDVLSISSVDYATFNTDKLFTITNDGIEPTKENLITAYCIVALSKESNVKTLSITPTVGVCYSKNNRVPTIDDDCLSLGSELKSYTYSLSELTAGTTYYFRVYVKLADGVFYGDVMKAKTLGTAPVDNSKTINGHKFIDLRLPSGLLWAETNIGAEEPADYGNYYAWGETEPKSCYYWNTYKYCTTSAKYYLSTDTLTKYISSDGKTTLDPEDDAAYVIWGDSCRMPTDDEFTELRNASNCTWTWTSMTNSKGRSISGYQVTSVKNGNSIFLPASGDRRGEALQGCGEKGVYWSSTLHNYGYHGNAYYLVIYSSKIKQDYGERYFGKTVRPVAKP